MYAVIVCCLVLYFCLVFFFKQKTAYEMRISDWSSDVCSSDLIGLVERRSAQDSLHHVGAAQIAAVEHRAGKVGMHEIGGEEIGAAQFGLDQIGRASCRERVCQCV